MILVSRPAPQLPRTLAALRRAGFKQVHGLPVADYESFDLTSFPADATALILTSAAALNALMKALRTVGPVEKRPGCLRFLPAYCVGASTAKAAQKAGLNVVYAGRGDAAALSNSLRRTANGKRQTFLHLHASNTTADWSALLAVGHQVYGLTAYHTAYLHSLPAATVERLQTEHLTHTLLFSPAGAARLRTLLQQSKLKPSGTAVALSEAVAAQAQGFWPQVVVSRQPSLASMLKEIDA